LDDITDADVRLNVSDRSLDDFGGILGLVCDVESGLLEEMGVEQQNIRVRRREVVVGVSGLRLGVDEPITLERLLVFSHNESTAHLRVHQRLEPLPLLSAVQTQVLVD